MFVTLPRPSEPEEPPLPICTRPPRMVTSPDRLLLTAMISEPEFVFVSGAVPDSVPEPIHS